MPNQPNPLPPVNYDAKHWGKLLEETRAEYWNSTELTEAEKRFLDDLESLPEGEWEPVSSLGQPLSDTIIEERGRR